MRVTERVRKKGDQKDLIGREEGFDLRKRNKKESKCKRTRSPKKSIPREKGGRCQESRTLPQRYPSLLSKAIAQKRP